MADQAESLRRLVLHHASSHSHGRRGSLTLVFGAEAAIGASVLSLQLALAWRRRDEAAALVDLSRHQPPLQALGSLAGRADLRDVMKQERTLRESWLTGPCGLSVVGGDLQDEPLSRDHPLVLQLQSATEQQHVVVDVQHQQDLLTFLPVADHCIFVSTAEPEMLTSTYRVIKQAVGQIREARCWLAMSQIIDPIAALELQTRIVTTCDRCLNLELVALGCLPWDQTLVSGRDHAATIARTPGPSPYRQAVDQILAKIHDAHYPPHHRCASRAAV